MSLTNFSDIMNFISDPESWTPYKFKGKRYHICGWVILPDLKDDGFPPFVCLPISEFIIENRKMNNPPTEADMAQYGGLYAKHHGVKDYWIAMKDGRRSYHLQDYSVKT